MMHLTKKFKGIKTVRMLFLALFFGVTLSILLSQIALAYHLFGGRWPNQTCCLALYTYTTAHQSYNRTALTNGSSVWNNSSAHYTLISTSNSSSAQVTLNDVLDTSVSWDGIAYLGPCNSCTYSGASVFLNTYYTSGYTDDQRQSVAAHELGHVAGLAHTDGCVLMTPSTFNRWGICHIKTPQQDDINGVNAQYH